MPGENYKKLMINHEINKFKLITVTPPIIKNLKKIKFKQIRNLMRLLLDIFLIQEI